MDCNRTGGKIVERDGYNDYFKYSVESRTLFSLDIKSLL